MHSSNAVLETPMTEESILIVEDEVDIARTVAYNLEREGYRVNMVHRGDEALGMIHQTMPNLIILDLMLPGLDGLSICQQIKSDPETKDIPIIMLSAKSEDSDVVIGLGLGADDYVSKPFSQRELVARVKVVFRNSTRQQAQKAELLEYDELLIDAMKHQVSVEGHPLKLTGTEFKLLIQLATNPNRVYTREQLILSALGRDVIIVDRNVDVHIASLRHKLGSASTMIETIHGIGYRFSPE